MPYRLIIVCLCLCIISLGIACSRDSGPAQGERRAIPVMLAKAEQRTITRTLEAVGNVQPAATVAVRPQVGGQIMEALVRSGQDVKKGDVLFRLDPRPFQTAVDEARAKLQRDQVLLKKAQEDMQRFSRLVKDEAVSQEQYDQAVTDAQSQRAAVEQDKSALAYAELQLEYATIRAPMSGRIGEVLIDPGNVIKANEENPMLIINTLTPAKITFAVPERYLPEILSEFGRKEITVRAIPEGDFRPAVQGTLTSIDNTVDVTTGTIKLEARFKNEDLRLWPGQFTRIRLELAEMRDALIIPAAAVLEGVSGPYAYVVKSDSTVEMRLVEVSREPDGILVVRKGINPGETVVIDGQLNLRPGSLIVPKNAQAVSGKDQA